LWEKKGNCEKRVKKKRPHEKERTTVLLRLWGKGKRDCIKMRKRIQTPIQEGDIKIKQGPGEEIQGKGGGGRFLRFK